MLLTVFALFQTPQPQRISWAVWAGFGVAFVLGVSLLVYFIARLRKAGKETEEEWSISKPSLFVVRPEQAPPHVDSTSTDTVVGMEVLSIAAPSSAAAEGSRAPAPTADPEPVPAVIEPAPPQPEPSRAVQSQEVAPDPDVTTVQPQTSGEALPFDDDVWAALEAAEQGDTSTVLAAPFASDAAGFARVDNQSSRERFVAAHSEPSGPAAVEPLAPAARFVETKPEPQGEANEGPAPQREPVMLTLANYGRELDRPSGHGGTIALAVVIVLVGGSMLAYFKSEPVKVWVGHLVTRIRGAVQSEPSGATGQTAGAQPTAYVFPSRTPEVVKNMVKARGAVHNASDAMLEALSLEVALERYDGAPPEIRSVPVKPDALAPTQRGLYEFDYDGKQFSGYRPVRLISNGAEVKFASPAQK